MQTKLPPDGTRVSAVTIESVEYDRPASRVVGVLTTVPSPFTREPNCYVDGVGVEYDSVKTDGEPDAEDATKPG